MRIYDLPASFAPFLEAEIREAVRRAHERMAIDAEGKTGGSHDIREIFVPDAKIDSRRTGSIIITVSDYPADSKALAFPIDKPAKVA